ncbi:MAG: FISUMP domain-containing protein, partial [Bacteroidota bacterium]
YTITPQNGSCIGTPADYVVTVNPALAVSVSIGSSANNICAGTPVTFTATPGNGGTTPGWQWKVNAINAINANNAVYTFSPVAGDVVTCELTSSEECTTGNTATSASITMTVFPNLPVSVSVSTPVTTVCQGAPVTFTATPGNGGTTPGWQWKVNAINAISANNANYTYTPVAGDMVTCELTSSETCTSGNPATSAGITMTVNPNLAVGVVVSPDAAAVCAGNPVTFFANPLSGGMTPAWQWKVNANNANNANNAVFTYSPVAGDLVTCEMTSSEACTIGNPATSAPVAVTVNPNLPVSVTVSTSSNIFCAGSAVTFTASPVHGGTMPAWQWKVNSINATGATNADYTYNPVSGDVVSCVLISSETCASGSPAISNNITMTAIPVLPAGITVTATANPFCPGTSVTFTATLLNGGTTPSYQWKVNAGNASNATNANYTYTPVAGDYVSCVMASNLACVSNSPVTSASILMTAHPVPNVSFIRCFDSISTTAAKPFKLRGGLPFGGTYSGPGVNSATGIFNPATAGAGTHTITYGYSNIFNCLSSASTQIFTFQSSLFTCGGILTDPRDSRHYSTFVLPNGSCWMKENLDFGTAVDGLVPQTDNCMPEKYVRNSPYGGQYSIFYQWDELMRYSSTEASQGLCPPGWHIPSSSEWNDLLVYYNGDGLAGGALKDAQLAGGFHSFQVGFLYLNNTWAFTTGQDAGSMYWTSTSTGNEGAVARGMNLLTRSVSVYNSSRSNAFPARCMKD